MSPTSYRDRDRYLKHVRRLSRRFGDVPDEGFVIRRWVDTCNRECRARRCAKNTARHSDRQFETADHQEGSDECASFITMRCDCSNPFPSRLLTILHRRCDRRLQAEDARNNCCRQFDWCSHGPQQYARRWRSERGPQQAPVVPSS